MSEQPMVQNIEDDDDEDGDGIPDPEHPDWHPDLPEGEADMEYHGEDQADED